MAYGQTLVSILLEPQLRVSTQSSFFRKPQSNASSLAERTLQLNLRMMQRRTMLDNRKPQSGAAGHLAVAFIHAVEPLKHALVSATRTNGRPLSVPVVSVTLPCGLL